MGEMITIPKAEFDRLVALAEDSLDEKAVADYLADPKPGVPAAFARRMLEGESLLKLWREHRGMNQSELARASGVNRVQIADIEKARKTGSVETLAKLATALDVAIDDLI
ncbi:helix-turn-helix transcriptional regulator [Roseovarius aquimarinus]|uniref:Helix-turn-helix transcriptional regulator n=1 Tax=Roseovarius aquimarinus TaxID=1229156 RepID=A0ABW7IAJ2_9RHOB